MKKRSRSWTFKFNDDGTMTQIITEEELKEMKIDEIERKKKELDNEFDPYYVPSTQACLPDEYKTLTNNPYVKYGNKYSFDDEDVDYDKE